MARAAPECPSEADGRARLTDIAGTPPAAKKAQGRSSERRPASPKGPTVEAVRDALDARAEDLFRAAWGEPERPGAREWRAKASSALAMVMKGPKRGLWTDHKAGEGGDILDFYASHFLGLDRADRDFPRVLEEASRWCGLSLDAAPDLAALEERRRRREAKAKAERLTEAQERAALVAYLRGRARPLEGTPAESYLASRGLRQIPAEGLAYVPELDRHKGLTHPHRDALVVWGVDDAGRVRGGQRILVMPDGAKAPEATRKPAFGAISGHPARFPARPPHAANGPLIVVESPEGALSVWEVTGCETWAVFGVGGFATAPLPLGRRIILCPDRDPPGSPAAKAFTSAVEIHLNRGCDLWVAEAPEAEGSKKDLNDTHQHAGAEAVRAAIGAARPLTPPPARPYHEAPEGSREEARKRPAAAIARFFAEALPRIRAAHAVRDAYAALDPDLEPKERARRQRRIRRKAQQEFGLPYLPTAALRADQKPPREFHGGGQGTGKTRAAEDGLLVARGMVSLVLVPNHTKVEELVQALLDRMDERSPVVARIKGREARDEARDTTMCQLPKPAKALAERGLSVPATLCVRCPFKDQCGYLDQAARLKRLAEDPAGVVVVAPREYGFLPLPGHLEPDLVVFDEVPPRLGHQIGFLSFDTLGEPLTFDRPKRRKGRMAETAEAADARAALLADVRPTLVAIRDAYQQTPETALRSLRERGVGGDRLDRVLAALHHFEDRVLGDRLATQIDAFGFAVRDGRPFNLESRLLDTIDDHEGKQLRAIRSLIEAVRLELEHGRDEPVAVLRCEDVGNGRKGVITHTLARPHFGPATPFLHMDGTGNHRIAEAIFGPLKLEWHPVERHAVVTQVVGKSFSRQSITGLNSRGDPVWPEDAARLRADLIGLCHGQPDALVVATKGVVEAMQKDGLRNPVAHFGALRGMNTWEHLNEVIVIGREQPGLDAVEGPARALAARAGDAFTVARPGDQLPVERRGLRLRQGGAVEIEVERHPDPWGDRVLQQIREAEVLQALDRVRPHYKPEPVRVTLLCHLALDVTVDQVMSWAEAKQGGSKVERALATRVLPLSYSKATQTHPHIWPNRKAAQRDKDLERIIERIKADVSVGHSPNRDSYLGNVPVKGPLVVGSCLCSSSGRRGGWRAPFRFLILARTAEAEAVLEARVGPVEDFRIESYNEAAEARPAPAQATPARNENLCGSTLSPAERAAFTQRRKEAYEALHPEARAGAVRAAGMNAALGRDVGDNVAPTFASDTAAKTGKSERSIQRDAARGEEIEPEAPRGPLPRAVGFDTS